MQIYNGIEIKDGTVTRVVTRMTKDDVVDEVTEWIKEVCPNNFENCVKELKLEGSVDMSSTWGFHIFPTKIPEMSP